MLSWACLAGLLALAGCGAIGGPPETMVELQSYEASAYRPYSREEIATHNLLLALDGTLPESRRIASMSVVVHTAGRSPAYLSQLASLLELKSTTPTLHRDVLLVLARRDYPGIDTHVRQALPRAEGGVYQQTLLDWLTRHRRPEALASVVRLWAQADASDAAIEDRFRRTVESMTGHTWSDAILDALNQPGFTARRSALAVLAARMEDKQLRRRIELLQPVVIATEALQYCLRKADYLADAADLLAVVEAYVGHRPRLDAAIAVSRRWRDSCGYRFTIRDVHLLNGLSADGLDVPDRSALLARVALQLRDQHRLAGGSSLVESGVAMTPLQGLPITTLIRLRLLCDMLSVETVREGIGLEMRRPAFERAVQWGGLIFLNEGRATPRLYQPGTGAGAGEYYPSEMMVQDARWCVAHIHGGSTVGPTAADVARVRRLGVPGLIVSWAETDHIAPVYYDGDGVVIPLGVFALQP